MDLDLNLRRSWWLCPRLRADQGLWILGLRLRMLLRPGDFPIEGGWEQVCIMTGRRWGQGWCWAGVEAGSQAGRDAGCGHRDQGLC